MAYSFLFLFLFLPSLSSLPYSLSFSSPPLTVDSGSISPRLHRIAHTDEMDSNYDDIVAASLAVAQTVRRWTCTVATVSSDEERRSPASFDGQNGCQSTHRKFLFNVVPFIFYECAWIVGMYFYTIMKTLQVNLS